jgi:penicillin-binding protein 1A
MIQIVRSATVEDGVPSGWWWARVGSGPEGAVLLADVASGEVLSMVGGDEYARGGFDRAISAKRQPGSAFKPFVFGAALAGRDFTAASVLSDSPEIYEKWKPTNFEADVYRGDVRLRVALAHSINTVAIKLLDAIGIPRAVAFARAVGVRSELAENLSLALGTSEVSPFELLEAYATLARAGVHRPLRTWTRIEVPGERDVIAPSEEQVAVSPEVAFLVTSLLRDVVEQGTGREAARLGRPAAGKTGTSADHRDAWFAGFTANHVAVTWVGFDDPRPLGRGETGGRAALPAWLTAMEAAEGRVPARDFIPPPGLLVRRIDAATGLLAPMGTPDQGRLTLEEYFLPGTEPTQEVDPEAAAAPEALLDLLGEGGDGAVDGAGDAPPSSAGLPEPPSGATADPAAQPS